MYELLELCMSLKRSRYFGLYESQLLHFITERMVHKCGNGRESLIGQLHGMPSEMRPYRGFSLMFHPRLSEPRL